MTKLIFFGDNDTTSDAVKVLDAIKKEQNVDQYVFLGDGPYSKTGTKWVGMMKPFFPDTSKLIIVQGNHDDEESESEKTQQDIEAWIPSLKDSPAPQGGDQSWENPTWLHSKQIGDIYLIGMNSQDMDVEFKRNQYNWVLKQLATAVSLRQQGKINWLLNAVHKPWFTLKSSHSPYTKVREIYSAPFQKAGVDQNWHGHNHNDQCWFDMVAINQEGNAAGKNVTVLAADGKTLDHSKPDWGGWTTNINGHSGHEHNKFKENATANKNVMWANDSVFSYAVVESNPQTKILNTKWKGVDGKVLFEYNITRAGVSTTPPQQPGGGEQPTSPPPGPGYRWDSAQKKWLPKLEDPAFIPDDDEPDPNEQKPDPIPIPPSQGEIDQMGIQWLAAKGAQTLIKQTRDTDDDDRWSGNVKGLRNGFEATMIAKSIGIASDGHFAMKQFSGNHSKNKPGTEKNAWYDTGLRSNGDVQLQTEYPHPKNHNFTLPDSNWFIKKISKGLEGNWIGLKWSCNTLKKDGDRANGGVRCRMWVDEDPIGTDGKPKNGWKLVYDFVDTGQIIPKDKAIPDEQDCEVRRSGTKKHEVYGNGLHIRAL